jgi:hypothetical protein
LLTGLFGQEVVASLTKRCHVSDQSLHRPCIRKHHDSAERNNF